MGDGKTYSTTNPTVTHTYQQPGNYTIKAIGTNTKGEQAEATTKIYIGNNPNAEYGLQIQPSRAFKSTGITYTFKTLNQ